MAQVGAAAGDRNVLVHGACTEKAALEGGVLGELHNHQVRARRKPALELSTRVVPIVVHKRATIGRPPLEAAPRIELG